MRPRTPGRPTGARRPGRRAWSLSLLILFWGFVLGACRVDAETLVEVRSDGSGLVTVTVTLDPEAVRQLGDPAQLSVADLAPGGWEFVAPTPTGDGGLEVGARRSFDSPSEVPGIIEQIAGTGVLIEGATLEVVSSQLSTDYRWQSVLRSTGELAVLSDPEIAELLDGLPLGRTADELAATGADQPGAAVASLVVRLPGGVEESASVPLAGAEASSVPLAATSTVMSWPRLLWLIGVVALLLGALFAAVRSRR
ncbi:MAG: hypothetical protein FJW94_12980 [Actinobacteria bacterium]|nr:hypothetical protein [Actinomycetota bacterium]